MSEVTTKKWLRRGFLLVTAALIVVALTPPIQRWLDRHGYIPNQYSYGDLYNLTNLPAFKEHNYVTNSQLTERDKPAKRHPTVDLYTIGDSFTDIDTCYYAGNRNVHVWVGERSPTEVALDRQKKNILVIEVIERVLQERMYWPVYKQIYIDGGITARSMPVASETAQETVGSEVTQGSRLSDLLSVRFGKEINQRLEFLLFNGPIATHLKELKAQLMFTLFDRVTGAVISKNEKHLFYPFEVDTTYGLSAFRKLPAQRLDTLVHNLNTIRQHYLAMGFDEVYLCLVPNKVTILDPTYGVYNHQIARIESNPRLEAPLISTIDSLRKHPDWYHLGDGHWNRQGKLFWLRQVNKLAAEWATKTNDRAVTRSAYSISSTSQHGR